MINTQSDKIQGKNVPMKNTIPLNVYNGIVELALKHGIEKVTLFGSCARGDNTQRSDIDLAVQGGNTVEFAVSINEQVNTLLMFDVVELDKPVQKELLEEIEKEGIIYTGSN